DLVSPSDIGLLTTAPSLVAKLLTNAAQHTSPNDPNVRGWQDYGCFRSSDSFSNTLTAVATSSITLGMSPQICIGVCAARGADYSFVIGDSCSCSVTRPPPAAGSTKCNTPCSASTALTCGNPATNAYSVFRRIIAPNNAIPLPTGPAANTFKYGGCFLASGFIADAETAGLVLENTDIEACSKAASEQGLRYLAGIGLCANECPGKPTQSCGGAISQGEGLLRRQATSNDLLITLFELAPPVPLTAP
ncbi:uncharacterized protein M421DRAFT_37761, partial [Didymella exigua CBS 183.55]